MARLALSLACLAGAAAFLQPQLQTPLRKGTTLQAVDSLVVEPIAKVGGVVRLPGSKSLSNRALLLAALAASDCARDAVAPLRRPLEAACDVATHHAVKPVRDAAGRALEALRQLKLTALPKRQQRSDRDVCASLASRMSVAGFYAPPPSPETHMSPVHFGDEPSPFVVAEAPVAAPPKVPGLALPVMAPLPAPAPTPALFASDILDDEPPPWRRPRRRRMRKHQPFFKPFVGGGDDLVQASSVGPSLAPLEPLRESVDALAMRCAKVEEALRERASVVRAPAPATTETAG